MKRISIVCLTGMLLFAACHNTGSSTVGNYEQEETSTSSDKESETHGQPKEHQGSETHDQKPDENAESVTPENSAPAIDTTRKAGDSIDTDTLKAGSRPE